MLNLAFVCLSYILDLEIRDGLGDKRRLRER